MATANITGTEELTAPVNVIAQRALLEVSKPLCPYFQGSMPANITAGSGSFTASWRRIVNLDVDLTNAALSPLNTTVAFPTRAAVQASTENIQATLGKYGRYIVLNEEVDLLNFGSHVAGIVEALGINAGRVLNALQRNEMEDNATAIFAGGAADAANVVTEITTGDLYTAINHLERNNALQFNDRTLGSTNISTTPIRDSYLAITHPDVVLDMRRTFSTAFTPVEKYGSQTTVLAGEQGSFPGVRIIQTTDATIDAEGGKTGANAANLRTSGNNLTDIYSTVVFGRNAFGSLGLNTNHIQASYRAGDMVPGIMMIRHAAGSSGAADPLNELRTVGYKTFHAAKYLGETASNVTSWARVIKSGALTPTGT